MLASSLFSVVALLGVANAAPAPIPSGGVGVRTNDTPPVYGTMSEFDYQSLTLGLYQEWIELDLFNYGHNKFSQAEFTAAGMNEDDVALLQFMANQEVGHATLLSDLTGAYNGSVAKQCTYHYDFETVRDFVNFCQRLTRWGESGVYGFISHLDSRPSATLLLQSITTEARQQMIFRQFSGAFPMPVYFETGISQSMSWSLLNRYITSCPSDNPRIEWPIFPFLSVTNEPNLLVNGYDAAISHNRTSVSQPGELVTLSWEAPGKAVGPDMSYNTSIGGSVTTPMPMFAAWISQLNVTYTPLNITGNNTGSTHQPPFTAVFNSTDDNIVNGTMFLALTDTDLHVTPYNLSLLNDHIFAFGLYQAD